MKNINSKIVSLMVLLAASIMTGSIQAAQQEQAYTTAYRYDVGGRLTGTISPDPDGSSSLRLLATRNIYDQTTGWLLRVEKGELSTWADENTDVMSWSGFTIYSKQAITYDDYGRKSTLTTYDQNGVALSLIEYSYDDKSRVLCTAQRMNLAANGNACSSANLSGANPDRISRFTYDEYDQVIKEERAVNTSVQQNYVTNSYQGRTLKSQVDANGNRTDLYYDDAKRLKRIVYPSPTSTGSANGSEMGTTGDYVEFQYDSSGNKTYERKRNGTSITYTLDNNNRVVFKDYSNASMQDISYRYDLRGLQLSARFGSDNGVGITNAIDGFGNVRYNTNSMFPSARTFSYQYDLNNNRKQIVHQDGAKFSYSFDGLNRVKAISDPGNLNLLTISYQPNGRRSKLTRGNGTTTTYNYTNGVQLDNFAMLFATPTSYNLINTFTYNAASQIETLKQSNNVYNYKGNENRTGDYATNGLNQYKKVGATLLDYDTNQNLKYDGLTYYSYDDENRLLTMTKLDDSTFNANLVYDPLGRLFQSTIKGKIVQYWYDGDALVSEYDEAGNRLRRYVHGDQVDEPLVQYNNVNSDLATARYLHADHQGSIIAQSDNTGKVIAALAYDSYGIPAAENIDRFGYTGQIWFKELGLDYYKARMYSPTLGRFLQTDPIGYKDQMNLYAYSHNDPLNKTDPSGKMSIFEGAAALIVGGIITYKLYTLSKEAKKAEQAAANKAEKDAARNETYLKKMNGENISAAQMDKVGGDAIKADKEFLDSAADLVKATNDATSIEIPGSGVEVVTQAVTGTVEAVTEKLTEKAPPPETPLEKEKK